MIYSMTGFGAAERQVDGMSLRVEVRSVNNRYFKAAIRLPEPFASLEADVEQLLRRGLGRGSVYFAMRARDESPTAAADINVAALRTYVERLRAVEFQGVTPTADLAALLALPGVCQPREPQEESRRRYQSVVNEMTQEAVRGVRAMRQAEGAALRTDLLEQTALIRRHLAEVRSRGPAVVQEYQQRLKARVNSLLAGAELSLNQDDLLREVALFAERCDVNEEIARLESHLDQFEKACDADDDAGRRLDFLAQEMLREANTIGAKANDAAISRTVVEVKVLIDRIKEQVQNVA